MAKMKNAKNIVLAAAAALLLFACEKSPSKAPAKSEGFSVALFNGAPFITENGKPVRGRISWVAASGAPAASRHEFLSKAGEWREWSFEFTIREKANCVAQMRFGEEEGNVLISNFEISEKASGKILRALNPALEKPDPFLSFWCAGIRKNPPIEYKNVSEGGARALKISIKKSDPLAAMLHLYTRPVALSPKTEYVLRIRAKVDAPRPFSAAVFNIDGGSYKLVASDGGTDASTVRYAADAGVNIVSFEIDSVWTPPNAEPDYGRIDAVFKRLLRANPDAKLLPRVRLDPQIHKWWRDSHQSDMMRNSDGSVTERYGPGGVFMERYVSISSPTYRREANESLAKFIAYCQAHYKNNMAGYHPAGGNSREWFYGGTWLKEMGGYDIHTLAAWRKWLEKKYKNIEALRAVWGENPPSFSEIAVPTAEERKATKSLIDPKTQWKIADFNFFLQDEMADMVLSLAKTVRKFAPDKLSVFFYGYGFEFSNAQKGPAYSGHYALERILKSPDIDALAGPVSYHDRAFGGCKSTMGATESVALAGKLWIDEDDTRTYVAANTRGNFPGKVSGADTLEATIQVLRRNLAQETIRNNGSWWMDLFGHGWFDDPSLWREMAAFEKPELDIIKHPLPYKPQTRLVMDEKSICFVGGNWTAPYTTHKLMGYGRACANRSGSPIGQYLLGDVLKDPSGAKLNVLLSVFALDAKGRAALKVVRENSANIWAWLPAYIDLDKREFSTDAVREATGFCVKKADGASSLLTATDAGVKMGLPKSWGMAGNLDTALSPIPESGDVVLALYSDGSPAAVLRTSGKHPQLFMGGVHIPSEMYRLMQKLAGAHVYCEQNAAVYANGAYLSVTATEDGAHKISLPKKSDVFNALTGGKIAENADTFSLEMKKGENLFLRLGRGNAEFAK